MFDSNKRNKLAEEICEKYDLSFKEVRKFIGTSLREYAHIISNDYYLKGEALEKAQREYILNSYEQRFKI